jgi:hypothetical protein
MMLARWAGTLALSGLIAFACGGESNTEGGTGGNGTGGSTTTGGGAGSSAGGSAGSLQTGGSGGLQVVDAAKDVATDPGVLAEAGWFDCQGCLCPGDTHYCLLVSAGMLGPLPPPDAATCADTDGGSNHCVPLPTGCNGIASCECVDQGFCDCADTGGGLRVHCAYP